MTARLLPPPLEYPLYADLLEHLIRFRFATTEQLARMVAPGFSSKRSAVRQCQRHLHTLAAHNYVRAMGRQVGGQKRGSGQQIWIAAPKAHQAISGKRRRPRTKEHSTEFIAHTLAVTETRVLLTELARQDNLHALELTGEPAAWRDHLGPYGQTVTLKPDLHLYARSSDREYYAFLEVDRATENPGRIIRQCWRYDAYYRSGLEQQSVGVFPVVIWICPNAKRTDQLRRHLGEHTAPAREANDQKLISEMFLVTTMDGLPDTIRAGLAPPPKGKRQ